MHYRAGIIRCLQMVYFVQAVLQKIIFHTTNDVASVDLHVAITIGSRLLMPKPCMIEEKYYNQMVDFVKAVLQENILVS